MSTKGPYVKIKIKDDKFEIGIIEEFEGPDSIDEAIRYLKAKYGIKNVKSNPEAYYNGR
jgi:hypothetical protein